MSNKIKIISLNLLLLLITLTPFNALASQPSAGGVSVTGSYKAVVKIHTYYEDENNSITLAKTASGVIVSEDGLILVDKELTTVKNNLGSELPVVFNVCLAFDNPYQPPICNYYADLVGQSDKYGLALLKIGQLGNLYSSFKYMSFAQSIPQASSIAYAYGYPKSASDTIFGLIAEISGSQNKNNLTLIKSDVLNYFESGGILTNLNGDLIGVITANSSKNKEAIWVDSINSLNYRPITPTTQTLNLKNKFKLWLKGLTTLNNSSEFINEKFSIDLEGASDWEYKIKESNKIGLYISQETPNESDNTDSIYLQSLSSWKADSPKSFYHSVLFDEVNNYVDELWRFWHEPELLDGDFNLKQSEIGENDFSNEELEDILVETINNQEENPTPYYTLIKVDSVLTYSPIEDNLGFVNLSWVPLERVVTASVLDSAAYKIGLKSSCLKVGEKNISGKAGPQMSCEMNNQEVNIVFLGSKNYLIMLLYGYGTENRNKSTVEYIINNIEFLDQVDDFTTQHFYRNYNPDFTLNLSSNWLVKANNSQIKPVSGSSLTMPNINFNIYVDKLDSSKQNLSNQNYFNSIKSQELIKIERENVFNLNGEMYDESVNYSLNNELDDLIFYKYRFADPIDKKVKLFTAGYRLRIDDKVIIISLDYFGNNEAVFEQQLQNFQNQVMNNISFDNIYSLKQETNNTSATESVVDNLEIKSILNIGRNFIGRILLQVEKHGEAWYLSPKTNKAHYLRDGAAAHQLMREQGLGITNENLDKIPVALSNVSGDDSDGDGLADPLEQALGTNTNNADSDEDGISDKDEIANSTDSLQYGAVKKYYNYTLVNNQKGRILLQVENRGEAWYVNPVDGKRYFLGQAEDAYQVMRNLGLGISENDFSQL